MNITSSIVVKSDTPIHTDKRLMVLGDRGLTHLYLHFENAAAAARLATEIRVHAIALRLMELPERLEADSA